jgi:hypothetical protein
MNCNASAIKPGVLLNIAKNLAKNRSIQELYEFPKVKEAAHRALEIDATTAEAYAVLAAAAVFAQIRTSKPTLILRLWELRAATSLAQLWAEGGRRAEAYDLLAPVYGWFTEGFETADVTDAKALLDELRYLLLLARLCSSGLVLSTTGSRLRPDIRACFDPYPQESSPTTSGCR